MGVSFSLHEVANGTTAGVLVFGFFIVLLIYLLAVLILGYHWHQFDLTPIREELKAMRKVFHIVSVILLVVMAASLFIFAR